MKDLALLALVASVEENSSFSPSITLVVGGFLISGDVVGYKEFLAHHPFTRDLGKLAAEVDAKKGTPLPEYDFSDANSPDFIHLKDAQYFTPGGSPIPANSPIYCRIKLEQVLAFHFGRLKIEKSA